VRRRDEKEAKNFEKKRRVNRRRESYVAPDFFSGVVLLWAWASVLATSSQSFCRRFRSARAGHEIGWAVMIA
jgi:hypothetical protein